MLVLGIETSCDETSVALLEGEGERVCVVKELTASQIKLHKKYGGVVPEVAARRHAEVIVPLLERLLGEIKKRPITPSLGNIARRGNENGRPRTTHHALRTQQINAIAVTSGPGLITSLMVGVETARTLSYAWDVPLVAVNHIEGHIYSNLIREKNKARLASGLRTTHYALRTPKIQFPALALIVSGGHTELILLKKHLHYRKLGATRDDAAGEAFDKVAKMLGLGYPGGPAISRCAEKGDPNAIKFPRPMIDSGDYDFSFAGLKTAVLYYLKDKEPHTRASSVRGGQRTRSDPFDLRIAHYALRTPILADLCASFEQAAVDVLISKTIRAAKEYKVKTVLLGGGVAANTGLRTQLANTVHTLLPTCYLLLPHLKYTTDNAAMIAAAGYFKARAKKFTPWQRIKANPEWEL